MDTTQLLTRVCVCNGKIWRYRDKNRATGGVHEPCHQLACACLVGVVKIKQQGWSHDGEGSSVPSLTLFVKSRPGDEPAFLIPECDVESIVVVMSLDKVERMNSEGYARRQQTERRLPTGKLTNLLTV